MKKNKDRMKGKEEKQRKKQIVVYSVNFGRWVGGEGEGETENTISAIILFTLSLTLSLLILSLSLSLFLLSILFPFH